MSYSMRDAVGGSWTAAQRHVVTACFLGWMLDAFDYFLVVFVLSRLAHDFSRTLTSVTWALTLTLMMRPLGALLFGRLADRFGRRPLLMASVLAYSLLECASAFAPTLTVFIGLRALYGIAMGGEWGVGASLAFETIPVRARGLVSGMLQAGYPCGYLLAGVAYGLLIGHVSWRGLFLIGALPSLLLVAYIYACVSESVSWRERLANPAREPLTRALAAHWKLALYAIALMTAFNFFSHGTQDLYPTFLGRQRGFGPGTIAVITSIYNVGAICGGLLFGRLSGRIGRRRAIALAAVLVLPVLPFWAFSHTPVALATSAFAMQFLVQGAWGVVPVHLNELSPPDVRATFPGVVYQLGNLVASSNATLQSLFAVHVGGGNAHPDYAASLALVCGLTALAMVVLALAGPERRDVPMGTARAQRS